MITYIRTNGFIMAGPHNKLSILIFNGKYESQITNGKFDIQGKT